ARTTNNFIIPHYPLPITNYPLPITHKHFRTFSKKTLAFPKACDTISNRETTWVDVRVVNGGGL
ncbi:hypothetical protein VB797_28735, partial [Rivularia sp. UHCC 0363]|nr:hypothetical protein [Rivularia sp. UHCC 0363]